MESQRCSVPISLLLPDEVITDILVNLPVKSIHRFRSVSKTWCSLSSNPNFIKLHLNHAIEHDKSSLILIDLEIERLYYIDCHSLASNKSLDLMDHPYISFSEPQIYITRYCNGLISYRIFGDYYIWNPSTNEYKTLPVSPPYSVIKKPSSVITMSSGLGYDCKLDDYKFLIIYSIREGDNFFSRVKVYTLGSESGKIIENIPYTVRTRGGCGVFVNGALHWAGTRAAVVGKRYSYDVILSFDMFHESVKDAPLPEELKDKSPVSPSMGVMRDHLCIFDNDIMKFQTQVWVMKEEEEHGGGGGGSWTKLFTIQTDNDTPFSYYLRPIKCFNNGLMLLQKGHTDLVLYDQKQKTCTKYMSNEKIKTISYVESLVSLNSRTYFKQEFYLQSNVVLS